MFKIYHNPRCGKSRQTLAIINDSGNDVEIIEYLKTPPGKEELRDIIAMLKIKPEALIRKGEAVYKEKFKGKVMSDEECINAMVKYPILIERPIVIRDDRAVIGRPPERVNDIL